MTTYLAPMDQDDLPPKQDEPEEPTGAGSLGRMAGTLMWLAILMGVAGALVYVAMHWGH